MTNQVTLPPIATQSAKFNSAIAPNTPKGTNSASGTTTFSQHLQQNANTATPTDAALSNEVTESDIISQLARVKFFEENPELALEIAEAIIDQTEQNNLEQNTDDLTSSDHAIIGLAVQQVTDHQQEQAMTELSQAIIASNALDEDTLKAVKHALTDAQNAKLDGETVALQQLEQQTINSQLSGKTENLELGDELINMMHQNKRLTQLQRRDRDQEFLELAMQFAKKEISEEQHQTLTQLMNSREFKDKFFAKMYGEALQQNDDLMMQSQPSSEGLVSNLNLSNQASNVITTIKEALSNNLNLNNNNLDSSQLQPTNITQQLKVKLDQNLENNQHQFTVKLHPADLGEVEVKLNVMQDVATEISFKVSNKIGFDSIKNELSTLASSLLDSKMLNDFTTMKIVLDAHDGNNSQQEQNQQPFQQQWAENQHNHNSNDNDQQHQPFPSYQPTTDKPQMALTGADLAYNQDSLARDIALGRVNIRV